jgi:hypothetical protein
VADDPAGFGGHFKNVGQRVNPGLGFSRFGGIGSSHMEYLYSDLNRWLRSLKQKVLLVTGTISPKTAVQQVFAYHGALLVRKKRQNKMKIRVADHPDLEKNGP